MATSCGSRQVVKIRADSLPRAPAIEGATLTGPMITRNSGEDQQVLALTGPLPATEFRDAVDGGIAAIDGDGASLIGTVPLPGAPLLITDHRLSDLVYVAGTAPGGAHEMWTLEPHPESRRDETIGLAAFDTTALPGTPLAMALDSANTALGDDHARLLVSTAGADGGTLSSEEDGARDVTEIPFGVFLAPAALFTLLWGDRLLAWYIAWARG